MDYIVKLDWTGPGKVSPTPDPVYADNNDTLSFQSDAGPVRITFRPDPSAPATFSRAVFKTGEAPVIVVKKGSARYDCTLLDAAGTAELDSTTGGPGSGGGVKPGGH